MALFTADLNNEMDQLKAAIDEVIEKQLMPATKELVHKDIKPAATEILIETRNHSAWIIKEAGAETQALVNVLDDKVTKSIELVDNKVSKQIDQIDDLLTKQLDRIDISFSNKIHEVEGLLIQNINEINDCISAQSSTFHKELRKNNLSCNSMYCFVNHNCYISI